ncbi:hypothetical protein ASD50_20335 [Mesorhizobium sp. Root552]|jgi:hypothetical protein|uniref:hypothetical protein n=1 Tax=Mesorhizobium sp. Root552 TaxID=1736555 RepID=UPI0006F5D228|nr:hypothetical protein [Mesorhizobium sp. Root552]KQZ27900.1 hypothetical protein ASD50_20335 [Mesorhizobium sp. Root552]
MTNKLSTYQIVTGGLSAIAATIAAAIFAQMLSQSNTLGEHTEKLNGVDTAIGRLEATMMKRFDAVDQSISKISSRIDASSIDLGSVIAKMGIVTPNDVFDAAVYDGSVWAFPADASVSAKLEQAGIRREQVNSALFGYRVMSLDALSPSNQQ